MGGVAVRPAVPVPPLQPEGGGEVVGQDGVVPLRHRHGGLVDRPGVQGPPLPVRALRPVGDHDVRVQVGVVLAGVPVVERRRDHAGDVDLRDPVGADPGLGDIPLDQRHDVNDRAPVRGVDDLPGRVVRQGPEHANGLRGGERAVEPRDRAPRVAVAVDMRELPEPAPGCRVLPSGEYPLHLHRCHHRARA